MNSPFCLQHPKCQIRTGGSIRSGVEEQSPAKNARATFFTGELLIWVNYWARIAWPGSWAHVSARGRRVRPSQTDRQTDGPTLASRGLGQLEERWDSALWKTSGSHWSALTDSQQSKTKMGRSEEVLYKGHLWPGLGNPGCNQGQKSGWKAFISIYNVGLSSHKETDWFK